MPYEQYLRLETSGRNSGKQHQVLLRFVTHNDKLFVFPLNSGSQDWVKNIAISPKVKVYIGNVEASGLATAKKISGFKDPLLSIFTRKYGTPTIKRWYWGQRTYIEIAITDMLGLLKYSDLVYGDLESAFDGVAEDYDRHIFGNPINTWLRNVSIGAMAKIFKPGQTVLEVGCGTGTETLSLARQGIHVIASDISEKMLKVLSRKASEVGLSDSIITLHMRPIEMVDKLHSLGYEKLDGAYSTYGAINTEPNMGEMVKGFHTLLKEGSPLLLGVWNKYCIYEIIGYLLRLNPSLAFARLRNPVPIGKSRFCVATNAFSVESLNEVMKAYFSLENVFGVVISLPPSNLTRYIPRGKSFNFLKSVDLNLGRAFPTNRLGDHFLALYRNRGG